MGKAKRISGRIEYLEMLYTQHGKAILRYLYRLVGPKMAEDVLQDTFVQALSSMNRLDSVAAPKVWLFTVAKNMAFNALRKKRMSVEVPWDSLIQVHPKEDDRLDSMRKAIEKLPPDYRETVLLRWYDQLSYEEIGQVLEIPVGTVRSRLHHALHKLRIHMNQVKGSDNKARQGKTK